MTVKEKLPRTREGLPREAFAIVGDPGDPGTWKLPHHKRSIFRALKGRLDIEETVDWERMPAAVAALSPGGYRGQTEESWILIHPYTWGTTSALPEDIAYDLTKAVLENPEYTGAIWKKGEEIIVDGQHQLEVGQKILRVQEGRSAH